ncbi:NAD-dependent succinate-semialdehyde dehydrogenase [Microbacterium betulae]|uniref:NAD-dependent succinate-semialdehyde dehydrogenase n=1 Tax=Microbacterium betulae TaxID=2981139 RepID=A0AA97I792_9MICO|nr:NAD-dependent succinate-semialdehyde dehydrogenase [Microbacterium sp. AB]WOF23372.1 NAD-dependent succinate-semialdehyde dehydrogenase [Microbacterium sp. AB]
MTSLVAPAPVRTVDAAVRERTDRALASVVVDRLDLGPRATFAVRDPATEGVIATLPDHTTADALVALERADRAGAAWARTTSRHRSDVLHRAYGMLVDQRDRLAAVITREMGKPLAEAYGEVQYAADYVRWYAEEALRPAGGYRESPAGGSTILTTRAPVGTALLITPWNFPMAMATRKIAPAIAAGCGVVVKPAALTPLTTLVVAEILVAAGVPDELVQVVTTTDAAGLSSTLMADGRVRKVSFTGSTGVGGVLLRQAAEHVVKSSMELGGNAPLLVFDDADLERAVEGAVIAKLRNGGQSCVAANRILVQDGIADAFAEGFAERMAETVVGNGLADGVALGPVIDERAVSGFVRLVDDAVAKGARLRLGGAALPGEGHFFEPTVLDGVPDDSDIAGTEIFGPVAAIARFATEDEGVARANGTPFGLASYVFTESLDRALGVADRLDAGMVGVNQGIVSNVAAPFGGVKASGLGREGGSEGLEEYQEVRFYNVARR